MHAELNEETHVDYWSPEVPIFADATPKRRGQKCLFEKVVKILDARWRRFGTLGRIVARWLVGVLTSAGHRVDMGFLIGQLSASSAFGAGIERGSRNSLNFGRSTL